MPRIHLPAARSLLALLLALLPAWIGTGAPVHAQRFEDFILAPSDLPKVKSFGHRVRAHRNFVIVGAPLTRGWLSPPIPGAAFVYQMDPRTGECILEADLNSFSTDFRDDFEYLGLGLDIYEDRAAIGSGQGLIKGGGTILLFKRDSRTNSWFPEAEFSVPKDPNRAQMGDVIELGSDMLIGSSWSSGRLQGAVYAFLYDRTVRRWEQIASPTPSEVLPPYADFGISLSLDGKRLLVGASGANGRRPASGAAFVFRYDIVTQAWIEEAKLVASDGETEDYFGLSVHLCGDTAILGAPCDDDQGEDSGSAYVFRRDIGTGTWQEEAKLISPDVRTYECFGTTVLTLGDTVAVSAPLHLVTPTSSGAVFLFEKTPNARGNWVQFNKLQSFESQYQELGQSLALTNDHLLAGSPKHLGELPAVGGVHIFRGFRLTLSLDQAHFVGGQYNSIHVRRGAPNAPTWLKMSLVGLRATPPPPLAFSDLRRPIGVARVVHTDARGDASWSIFIPTTSDIRLWLQAHQPYRKSNVLETSIR